MSLTFRLRALLFLVTYYAVLAALGAEAVAYGTVLLVWAGILWLLWRSGAAAREARRAALAFEEGDYPAAIAAYTAMLERAPRSAEAWLGRGAAHYQAGHAQAAISDWREALRLRPQYAEAHANLGNAWLREGDFSRAIDALDEALRINPRLTFAQYNLACAWLFRGEFAAAAAAFRACLASDAGQFEAGFLAAAREDVTDPRWNGWMRGALTAATAAIAHDPSDAAALLARAIGHLHFGTSADAAADCDAALRAGGDDPLALLLRGLALGELGRAAESAADLGRARAAACRGAPRRVE